jgi:large subunit ribosomal protein L18
MARSINYRVPFRRRRKGLTDYHSRKKMMTTNIPRLVVRATLNNTNVQIIKATVKGDKTLSSAHTIELANKFGWKAPSGNLPAAYLTGFLAGHKALKIGANKVILDIGIQNATRGSRVFASMKGALHAGLDVQHEEKILPSEERTAGKHISKHAINLAKKDPERYKRRYSKFLAKGLKPEELPKHFEETKKKISNTFKGRS